MSDSKQTGFHHPLDVKPIDVNLIPLPPHEFIMSVGGSDYHATGKHFFDLFMAHVRPSRNATVLDVGAGCGRLAVPLTTYLNPTAKYHGIDIEKPMVDWCSKEITSRYSNFKFHHADLSNTLYTGNGTKAAQASDYKFPFDADTVDFTYLTSVFTHLNPNDTKNYLAEIERVLKPGGQVFMTFYILNDQYRRSRAKGTSRVTFDHGESPYWVNDPAVPEAVCGYDETYLFDAIRSAGLTIRTVSYGGWDNSGGWSFQDVVLAFKPAQ